MSPRPPSTSRFALLRGTSGLAWGTLCALLAALILATALHDRTAWPTLVGDEATYLMQAESLAFDLDLVYSAADYERFVRHWGRAPEGVILQKGTGSDALVYGKPFFYAAWAAPFTRLSPTRGPFVANALLLALAALVSARALSGRSGPAGQPAGLGAAAPLWVAAFVFASVTFAHVFWAHMDLFLACCTALGMALLFGRRSDEATGLRALLPFAAAGVLLMMVAYSRPLYASLLLPAGIAAWSRGGKATRGRAGAVGIAWTAGGAVLLALLALGVHESLAGSWTSYGAERRSFNSVVGFPGVDVPEDSWEEMIREWGNASWLKRRDLRSLGSVANLHLWTWNTAYFLFGRSVGLAPYFGPAFLAVLTFLVTRRRRRDDDGPEGGTRGERWARWALLAAVATTAVGFLVIRPFNFYGGGGALANRYFLPVYPALWFLVSGPPALSGDTGDSGDRLRRLLRRFAPAATALLVAPFLWPLWSAPRAYPVDGDGVFRYVSRAAIRWLPFESTQNHLKPGGPVPEYLHHGLWVKLLDPDLDALTVDGTEGGAFLLRGGEPASLLVGSERPLSALEIAGRPGLPPLEIGGGDAPGSGNRRTLELDDPVAVHPMWWTREDFYLYELTLAPDPAVGGDFGFTLRPGGADRSPGAE